jgi:hypothetical protein
MRIKYFVIAVFLVAVGFGGCKKEPSKSQACDIETFSAGGQNWQVSGLNITATFPKGTNVSNLITDIKVSDKATVSPASGVAQDFSNDREVKFTVTAENGKAVKVYTAKATVSANN